MKDILIQTYILALPIILTAFMSYVTWHLKTEKKARDANTRGTMLLLRVQLIQYHESWIKRGYVTKHGLENFIEMYESYHELGGNGMVTQLLKEVEELEIK